MEWFENLNKALNYIEDTLSDTFQIEEAARLACCSTYHFQRMFTYIAGIPLSEYIRRRKMTLAAADLIAGSSVLDTALRYGYDSPTAFNRAFQSVHQVPPSQAKKEGVSLKAYPRITFKLIIKGDAEMNYQIITKPSFRIVGLASPLSKELEQNFSEVPKLWAKASESGLLLQRILPLMNQEPRGVLGVSACMDAENGGDGWCYYIAAASDLPIPEDLKDTLSEYTVPACTWAVFSGKGTMPDSVQELEKRAVTEWLPSSGYEYADAPDIELYLNADPANAVFEVWLPVHKKNS